jgi:hypothetical protein
MTAHPGWAILTEDLQERVDNIKESMLHGELSVYDVGLAQAHVKVYREIINLRLMVEQALKQAQEDEADSI